MKRMFLFLGVWGLSMGQHAIPAPAEHRTHTAHTHGIGKVTLALIDQNVAIALKIPADSILGFEHAPESNDEKKALRDTLAILSASDQLFKLDAIAGCRLESQNILNPFDNGASKSHQEAHADFEAEYEFVCTNLQRLHTINFFVIKKLPRLHTLMVEYVTENSAGKKELNNDNATIELPKQYPVSPRLKADTKQGNP